MGENGEKWVGGGGKEWVRIENGEEGVESGWKKEKV